LSTYKHWEN